MILVLEKEEVEADVESLPSLPSRIIPDPAAGENGNGVDGDGDGAEGVKLVSREEDSEVVDRWSGRWLVDARWRVNGRLRGDEDPVEEGGEG